MFPRLFSNQNVNTSYNVTSAKAIIKGGSSFPSINGLVELKEVKNGVMVTAKINGLPKSTSACQGRFFGLHIHQRNLLYW